MGFFHDGHVALMKHGQQRADKVVVSLFVNPAQFGPAEDLDSYPQNLQTDMQVAEEAGVDVLFHPAKAEIYTNDHQTTVCVAELSKGLCGKDRPQHFPGVATVVSKLFNIVEPDMAVFGKKDYQQLAVIKKMVADLNFNVEIIGHEIVREADGLAMSSRNAYLDKHERRDAAILFKALTMVKQQVDMSPAYLESQPLLREAETFIIKNSNCTVDYLAIIDSSNLEPKSQVIGECRIAGAIRINNKVRLIDNMAL
jgi:pantoate--beta-alanine ligase